MLHLKKKDVILHLHSSNLNFGINWEHSKRYMACYDPNCRFFLKILCKLNIQPQGVLSSEDCDIIS